MTKNSVGWRQILAQVEGRSRSLGFDLVGALPIGAYNRMVDESARIADLGDAKNLALVIANTKTLWPAFVQYLRQNPEYLQRPDPLDRYVESSLSAMFAELPVRAELRWAHKPEPAHVSMQTLAQLAGIGYKSDSNLVVHPVYGQWIALRAVAMLPVHGPDEAFEWTDPPCAACRTGCGAALATALAGEGHPAGHATTRESWMSWVAIRDACPLGKAHRYSEEQIRYHYTKDIRLLEASVQGQHLL